MLECIKDIVIILAAIAANIIGFIGLRTWQKQLRGTTEYTLAKNVLAAIYELRASISSMRFWISFRAPHLDIAVDQRTGEMENKWLETVRTYEEKWRSVSSALTKLRAVLFETEAVWGQKFVDSIDPIYNFVTKLRLAIQFHIEAGDPNTPSARSDMNKIKEREAILYGDLSEEDEFSTGLNDAIHKIEIELKPHISRHHN